VREALRKIDVSTEAAAPRGEVSGVPKKEGRCKAEGLNKRGADVQRGLEANERRQKLENERESRCGEEPVQMSLLSGGVAEVPAVGYTLRQDRERRGLSAGRCASDRARAT
jgi:hypothetical protein